MSQLQFAMIGAGFWARYQLSAWREIPGARCVAICDTSRDKAEHLAAELGVPNVYSNATDMFQSHQLDFVDIVTNLESHAPLVRQALESGISAICQKPLAESLEVAAQLCQLARSRRLALLVHENWRWQAPLRRIKQILDSGHCGRLIRARLDYAHSFPVFDNQPGLKQLEHFILADMGTHILDVSRFLFGEAIELYCQTRTMHPDIRGEDVATVLLRKASGLSVTCNMSYASHWEFDRFPQTMLAVEGTQGGVSLGVDYEIRLVDATGTQVERVPIPQFAWVNPQYELVHASMVDCQQNLLCGLRGAVQAETTGEDNLRTLQLVYAAYESAARSNSVRVEALG
jgi:predicted dehydrogenase